MTTDSTVVLAAGELDFANAEAALAEVTADADASPSTAEVVLDMRLVNFVDAFAIGQLMAIRTTLCQSG